MSKLAQHLQHRPTGKLHPRIEPLRFVDTKEQTDTIADRYRGYCVEARFRATFQYDGLGEPGATNEDVRHAKRQIIEEVFGEYRGPLNDALDALYNYDFEEARKIIEAVLKNFDEPEPMPR